MNKNDLGLTYEQYKMLREYAYRLTQAIFTVETGHTHWHDDEDRELVRETLTRLDPTWVTNQTSIETNPEVCKESADYDPIPAQRLCNICLIRGCNAWAIRDGYCRTHQ